MARTLSIVDAGDGLSRTHGAAVDVAFRVGGEGPAVVLLHGTSANHAVWTPVGDLLEDRATVIALDQRGHGRSDAPVSGYDGDDFVGDVITVLDALGIERAVVAGHSLGGRNAWLSAARHPERVSGAVVVDYVPGVEHAVLDELATRVAGGFRDFASLGEVEAYIRGRYTAILPGAVERRAAWGYLQDEHGAWRPRASASAMARLIEGFRTSYEAEFVGVSTPMTHMRGDRSAIVSERAWQQARNLRPHDRWVDVADADHYIPEERPDLVAAEIARVLGV